MIRIDEIYNNTFWPWMQQNLPKTRMFFCDPPGRSDPASLKNLGSNFFDSNYIFFHDQEPVYLDLHRDLFDSVYIRNRDLNEHHGCLHSAIITSEKHSDSVDEVTGTYNWRPYYYFYHGWAALDWYRGYNKTFLMQPWVDRKIKKTFIAPNRIVAGKRQHRLVMLYHIFKSGMTDNHISCPTVCPAEHISIHDAVINLAARYPDISQVFAAAELPRQFKNETDHPMHSCWLSLFEQSAESMLYLVTETVAQGRRQHLTEKIFKPIALGMPFILVGTKHSLRYLREYGFKTFEGIWDESYDNADDDTRIDRIASLLRSLDQLPRAGKQELFQECWPIIQHNWNHFYSGGFETVLWDELTNMLAEIKQDFGVGKFLF